MTDAGSIASYTSVELFAERLGAKRSSFELCPANTATVAALVRRLGGIPLVIELAAARSAVIPIERAGDGLSLDIALADSSTASLGSLGSAIDSSLELLSSLDQRLFERLAVFSGSFDLEAAKDICADLDTKTSNDGAMARGNGHLIQRLSRLTQLGLVQASRDAGSRRYHLVDILHAYADDRLQRGRISDCVHRRHANYFANLAERAATGSRGADALSWTTHLTLEHDNLRSALRWARECDPELALRIAGSLGHHWMTTGCLNVGRYELEQALLAAEGRAVDCSILASALSAAGDLARQQSDFAAAHGFLERALHLARKAKTESTLASTLRSLGNLAVAEGQRDAARDFFVESLTLYQAMEDRWGEAVVRNNLGVLEDHLGHTNAAIEQLEQSVALFERAEDPWNQAKAQANLVGALGVETRWSDRAKFYHLALDRARQQGDRLGIASILYHLAYVEHQMGWTSRAWDRLGEALPIIDDTADRQKAAEWLDLAAQLAAEASADEVASVALGASDGLRNRWRIDLPPKKRAERQALLDRLRQELGTEELDRALSQGGSDRWQAVARLALRQGRQKRRPVGSTGNRQPSDVDPIGQLPQASPL